MRIPLSWLKEFVDLDLPIEDVARALLSVGLEVEDITVVGLPFTPPGEHDRRDFRISGLTWERDKFVTAAILEVLPHPNADRLVLCKLDDGGTEPLTILTGAPNLYDYKGKGPLAVPLKVAYAREGARLYDGHQAGLVLTTLKRAVIRGVESFSMVCSEKELGISEEHEGVILLDADAPVGMPLMDYMGDAVFNLNILPNMIRDASVLGVARELSALLGKPLRKPQTTIPAAGASIDGRASIHITEPALNPRFVLGLVRGVTPKPSPYKVQLRLRLAGMRPINSIVDATNYVMLEVGEPLHAFDYDVLVQRAVGKAPTIITRPAAKGEKLTTLDNVERELDDFTVLVCDTAGALSLAGVMGGLESEVTGTTTNVLLEGASWNFVNTRRTVFAQRLNSEAAYRFARGVHPALAELGVRVGLDRIAGWSGGEIAAGLVDEYPLKEIDPTVTITHAEITCRLGMEVPPEQIITLLQGLEFAVTLEGDTFTIQTPPHRLDIHPGVIGKADIVEEIARMVGFDNIPATRLAELMPPIHPQPLADAEEKLRDTLVRAGLQEIITYRLTEPAAEARLNSPGAEAAPGPYLGVRNPLTPEHSVLRRSLISSVLGIAERNSRTAPRQCLYEIGPVFLPREGEALPEELLRLAIVMTGKAFAAGWDRHQKSELDFFDLKGVIESTLSELHIPSIRFTGEEGSIFHPGKCAAVFSGDTRLGIFGELHPLVQERFDLGTAAVICAEFDLLTLLPLVPARFDTSGVPGFPPVLEDLALVVEESIAAEKVADLIRQTGVALVSSVRLFDVFRGGQVGSGKKSLAYSITYQATDRTLTDAEVAGVRQKIIKRLERELGAVLRS
jgi:phenylalanyl-tRNA synthetase beta chain